MSDQPNRQGVLRHSTQGVSCSDAHTQQGHLLFHLHVLCPSCCAVRHMSQGPCAMSKSAQQGEWSRTNLKPCLA